MKTVLNFLTKLKNNNNKEWFDAHRSGYEEAREEFLVLVDDLLKGIRKFDARMSPDLSAKQCAFRIYRDVRFSKDKKPYKTNMGASMDPGGKKSLIAGYYIHIEPGASFIAGGVWQPEPPMLQSIRQEIDYNPEPLLKIIKSAGFKKHFKGLDEEDKLKTVPKGFSSDHQNIELLKNRHFLVSRKFSDKEIQEKTYVKEALQAYKAMYPFLEYLREAQGMAGE
jgi:uncharacterized protein (TIGR02453 family)